MSSISTFGLGLIPGNIGSAASGNLAGGAATRGRSYQDVGDYAQKLGFKPDDLVDILEEKARKGTKFDQGVAMENLAFSRGLNADQMRQNTYNEMAVNEQKNRFDAAKTLLNEYNNARQTTANLMASTLRF